MAIHNIDVHEAKQLLDDKEAILIDLREAKERLSGHIKGARPNFFGTICIKI